MEHVSSVRPTGKFPEKVENLKRWSRFPGWNFRTECRVPFTFLVVCTSSRSTVGHRHEPGFTTKWNNFLPMGNSTFLTTKISGFFPKWKAPHMSDVHGTVACFRLSDSGEDANVKTFFPCAKFTRQVLCSFLRATMCGKSRKHSFNTEVIVDFSISRAWTPHAIFLSDRNDPL